MIRGLIWKLTGIMLAFMMLFSASVFADELSLGYEGDAVYNLQIALQEQGYLYGEADGIYGDMTEEAVMAYQSANGLEVTGIADDYTQALLFGSVPEEQGPFDDYHEPEDGGQASGNDQGNDFPPEPPTSSSSLSGIYEAYLSAVRYNEEAIKNYNWQLPATEDEDGSVTYAEPRPIMIEDVTGDNIPELIMITTTGSEDGYDENALLSIYTYEEGMIVLLYSEIWGHPDDDFYYCLFKVNEEPSLYVYNTEGYDHWAGTYSRIVYSADYMERIPVLREELYFDHPDTEYDEECRFYYINGYETDWETYDKEESAMINRIEKVLVDALYSDSIFAKYEEIQTAMTFDEAVTYLIAKVKNGPVTSQQVKETTKADSSEAEMPAEQETSTEASEENATQETEVETEPEAGQQTEDDSIQSESESTDAEEGTPAETSIGETSSAEQESEPSTETIIEGTQTPEAETGSDNTLSAESGTTPENEETVTAETVPDDAVLPDGQVAAGTDGEVQPGAPEETETAVPEDIEMDETSLTNVEIYQLPDSLYSFLIQFSAWYEDAEGGREYHYDTAVDGSSNIMSRILNNGSCVNTSLYPGPVTEEHWGETDPREWAEDTYPSYAVFNGPKTDWIARNIFNISDEAIKSLCEQAESEKLFYREGDDTEYNYYVPIYVVGDHFIYVDILSAQYDGTRYYITYDINSSQDFYSGGDEYLGTYYAVMEQKLIDEVSYWSLYSNIDITNAR